MTTARPQSSAKGIACMVLGGFLLTLNDAIQKWMSADFPTGQLLALRGMCVLVPVTIYIWRAGGLPVLRVKNYRGQLFRCVLVCVSSFLFVTALSLMPLADAVAITFAGPLFITAMAPKLLGEHVGWRRWTAVLVGFAGVLIIVKPSGGALQWIALLPLGVALCGAFRDIVTRHMHGTETTAAILFYSTLAVVLAGLSTAPWGWKPLAVEHFALFAVNGIVLGGAYYFLIEALRHAEASVVSPFKYVSLVWAVVLGVILWGDVPEMRVAAGALIIVASGLYIFHRELRRRG